MSTSRLPAPFRPVPLRAANALGRGLGSLGWRGLRLDEDRLLGLARQQTKLDDFGPDSFLLPLRKLLDSLERDAQLNAFGRFFARRQLVELLGHRLQLVDHRKRHPEVADQQIRRPLFVMGLPRTGTTLLYGLLARDPAHRAPLSWEVDAPCPPPETATYANDPRIAATEARMQQLRELAPRFQEIHPVGALMPQECIVITASEFMGIRFEMCFDVASYQEWFVDQDMRPAYQWHRHFLQHLQSRCPGERWVLKSPGHLGPIAALLETYPDALIVQTHRDPLRVVPSVSSLEYCMRGVASDAVDPVAIGRQQLRLWSALLEQGMQARAQRPDRAEQFLDLHFHEIIADPIGCVQRIYRHFDLELTADAEARMRAYLVESPRAGHGVHDYDLESFGLDAGTVSQTFKRYSERFGIRPEPI